MHKHVFIGFPEDERHIIRDHMKGNHPEAGIWSFTKWYHFGQLRYTAIGETMTIPHNSMYLDTMLGFIDSYYESRTP